MLLGREVDLDPSNIVLDGDPAPLPQKGAEPSPIFGTCLLWPSAGCIKMPLGKEVGLDPGHIVLHGDPAPPKQGHSLPQFSAHVCCGQTDGWIKMPLGTKVGLGPGHIVLHGG